MPTPYLLAPSILSADFARLGEEVAAIAEHADLLHIDAMDGHFVPPITIGPVVVASLRKITDLPLECHLMVTDPLGQAEQFAEAGGDAVLMHLEAMADPTPVVRRCRELGLKVGVSLNPPTSLDAALPYLDQVDTLNCMTVNPGWAGQAFIPSVLAKIAAARAHIDSLGLNCNIAVDGGINLETARQVLEAGANVLGAASAIFGKTDAKQAAGAFRALLDSFAAREH